MSSLFTALRPLAIALGFTAIGAQLSGSPARALDQAAIESKFAEVLVLTPVDAAGQPTAVDGVGMVALFSSQAATDFEQRLRQRETAASGSTAKPRSYSLIRFTAFEAAYRQRAQSNPKLSKTYVVDPTDAGAALGLLQQQGLSPEQARILASREAFVFCPDPLIRLTNADAKGQGASTRVVCSVSFVPIALLVNRSTPVLKTPAVVRAYTFDQLYGFLKTQTGDDARNLVITTPLEALLNSNRPNSNRPNSNRPASNSNRTTASPASTVDAKTAPPTDAVVSPNQSQPKPKQP
jgi:hypothetical protein